MAMLGPGAVFQYRKGTEVLLARFEAAKNEKVVAVGEDGRRIELPWERVLQAAGSIPGAPTEQEVRARLKQMRTEAEALVPSVDLALLWELVRDEPEGAPVAELAAIYHGRSGEWAERLAFGYALCRDRIHFRQKGDRFAPRMESEVRAAIERREQEKRAAERRAAFLAWLRSGLLRGAMDGTPPEGAAAELAAIEDLAVRGEEAPQAARAKLLLCDLGEALAAPGADEAASRAPPFAPTADGAFDLLVRIGVFTEHENLALRRTGIPAAFPPLVLAAASAVARFEFVPESEPWRRDLRRLYAVTIDDAETEDRDDALSVELLGDSSIRLGVHIADAAHFVPPGSPLDEEALRRGTTVYLPRGKLAMLPPVLSEDRLSLEADGRDRAALSFLVTFDREGSVLSEEIVPSAIRIARNLTYEEAEAALARGDSAARDLAFARDIAQALGARRLARGAIELRTPEVKVFVDAAGEVAIKRIEARSPAREMVAELMILANEVAARTCRTRGIPAIYRRQDPPLAPLPSREEAASPEVWAAEVRRRLARTELSGTPGPHFSLALDCYVQVTSPLRRYQDLAMERQIEAAILQRPLPYGPDDIIRIAAIAEIAALESGEVERETKNYWLLRYLEKRRGEPLEAVVLAEREGRNLVELTETLLRATIKPRARLSAGERIRVRVDGVNARRGELYLSPVT